MEVMRSLVKESQKEPEESVARVGSEQAVKLTKLTESDDVEAYLTTFKRMMEAYQVDMAKWAYLLAPQLTGKAQQAYAAMAEAILKRFNISEESYRMKFRAVSRRAEESYSKMATRMIDLLHKLTHGCERLADALELFAMEQLLNSVPVGVRIWLSERKPKTVAEAGSLADDYAPARNLKDNGSRSQDPSCD